MTNSKTKKTFYLDANSETGKKVDTYIENRDRYKYSTISDYLIAAVLAFEEDGKGTDADTALADQIAEKVAKRLREQSIGFADVDMK